MGQLSNFDVVVSLFAERTGISVPPSRRHLFDAAIRRAMRLSGTPGVEQFCARIISEDAFVEEIIRELSVGETYFFRDPKHFDFVRSQVVPDVFLRHGPQHVLRAWSAGCSTGEEPYSLAIAFEEDRIAPSTQIIATDLSQRALEHARRGEYRPWSLRGQGTQLARAHMQEQNGQWVLESRIKRRVEFRQLNLVTDAFPGNGDLDLIFCRNVLIYFEREAIAIVARKLVEALSEGGYLIMGPSDPSLLGHVSLEPIIVPEGIFFRRQRVVRADVPVRVQAKSEPEPDERLSEPELSLVALPEGSSGTGAAQGRFGFSGPPSRDGRKRPRGTDLHRHLAGSTSGNCTHETGRKHEGIRQSACGGIGRAACRHDATSGDQRRASDVDF